MKTILACTDGSVYATSVYDHAAWVAKRTEGTVHVLHMLDRDRTRATASDLSGNLGPGNRSELLEEMVSVEEARNRLARERGTVILKAARQHILEAGATEVKVEQQHGELVEAVTRLESGADLIVVGKRGEAADFAKLHLGSNLERVIRASTRPILVTSRKFVPIERFLIAYDGGPSVEKAIRYAIESPLLRGLTCHLLRSGKVDDDARWYLGEAAEKLRAAGFTVEADATPGDPGEVIRNAIRERDIQLLVMGAYGHSRIRHLMIGSTTTEMVRTCLVPVLMFR